MPKHLQRPSSVLQIFRRPEADDFHKHLCAVFVAEGEIRDKGFLSLVEDFDFANQLPAVALRPELLRK